MRVCIIFYAVFLLFNDNLILLSRKSWSRRSTLIVEAGPSKPASEADELRRKCRRKHPE